MQYACTPYIRGKGKYMSKVPYTTDTTESLNEQKPHIQNNGEERSLGNSGDITPFFTAIAFSAARGAPFSGPGPIVRDGANTVSYAQELDE